MLDVVVFGATGDTGRCCCHFLHNKGALLGLTSWAAAARNPDKLALLLGDIVSGKGEKTADGVLASPAIKADVADYASMLAMAKSAKVVVSCAGPFADMGEAVVKACVEAGTDYCDITGETFWVEEMAQKYGEEAKKKGVSIVSQAAYDSVPSDITVALAAQALMRSGEQVAAAETHHVLKGGALPVGTLKTLLNGLMMGRRSALSLLSLGYLGKVPALEEADQAAKKAERALLKGRPGFIPSVAQAAIQRDTSSNFVLPYTGLAGTFSQPSIMTSVNSPIVHTTAVALGYGVDKLEGFSYRERIGANDATASSLYGLAPYALSTLGLTAVVCVAMPVAIPLLFMFPDKTKEYAEAFNNSDPGAAKAHAFGKLFNGFQPNGLTGVKSIVSSVSGNLEANATFQSDYEAGLGFTALSVITVAAALLEKKARSKKGNGFETAVVAIGPDNLKDWYDKVGVRIGVSVHPARNAKL